MSYYLPAAAIMARRVLLLSASFAVVMVMMMGGWTSEAAISCGQVIPALAPCINYVRAGGNMPVTCCTGARSVLSMSKANADLKIACGCIKQMTMSMPGVKYELVNSIPGKCGVAIPWKLSPTLDCSK